VLLVSQRQGERRRRGKEKKERRPKENKKRMEVERDIDDCPVKRFPPKTPRMANPRATTRESHSYRPLQAPRGDLRVSSDLARLCWGCRGRLTCRRTRWRN
jgi:hypothetical protein